MSDTFGDIHNPIFDLILKPCSKYTPYHRSYRKRHSIPHTVIYITGPTKNTHYSMKQQLVQAEPH
jgi:hypothetical protein